MKKTLSFALVLILMLSLSMGAVASASYYDTWDDYGYWDSDGDSVTYNTYDGYSTTYFGDGSSATVDPYGNVYVDDENGYWVESDIDGSLSYISNTDLSGNQDIQGWSCPACGAWTRGDECWNCGYGSSVSSDVVISGPLGFICPICGESNQSGNTCWNCGYVYGSNVSSNGVISGPLGFICPICGESNQSGNVCWNCGYVYGSNVVTTYDIQGWSCPACGAWARGDECWNCGYRPGGSVTTVVVPSTTTVTTTTTTATAAPAVNDRVTTQINLIFSQFSTLRQDDSQSVWYYAVTDLDHNGFLELLATRDIPGSEAKQVMAWEVSTDGKSLKPCTLPSVTPPVESDAALTEGIFLNIHVANADTYFDSSTNTYQYVFKSFANLSSMKDPASGVNELTKLESGSTLSSFDAVSLVNGNFTRKILASCVSYILKGGYQQVLCRDNSGSPISMDAFLSIGDAAFPGMQKSSTNFDWFTAAESANYSRFVTSYNVFSSTVFMNTLYSGNVGVTSTTVKPVVYLPNGVSMVDDYNGYWVQNDDGTYSYISRDGTVTTYRYDGSTETILPDGFTMIDNEYGYWVQNDDQSFTYMNADGYSTTYYGDGSSETVTPNGNVLVDDEYGYWVQNDDGTYAYISSDGASYDYGYIG